MADKESRERRVSTALGMHVFVLGMAAKGSKKAANKTSAIT